jgi:hypothetical protein
MAGPPAWPAIPAGVASQSQTKTRRQQLHRIKKRATQRQLRGNAIRIANGCHWPMATAANAPHHDRYPDNSRFTLALVTPAHARVHVDPDFRRAKPGFP